MRRGIYDAAKAGMTDDEYDRVSKVMEAINDRDLLDRPLCPDCGRTGLAYYRTQHRVHCGYCDWQRQLNDGEASHLVMYALRRTEDRPVWAMGEH